MSKLGLSSIITLLASFLASAPLAASSSSVYLFSVINQRTIVLTAAYWNPILEYVCEKSGVKLRLRMGRTAVETTKRTLKGEFDFVFSNHLFHPSRTKLGYKVILKTSAPDIASTIVVLSSSSIESLKDLAGKDVAFPSREAFVGYWVPMQRLRSLGIDINPKFSGNQEGAMAKLQSGAVAAAAVNDVILNNYAQREHLFFRPLWRSEAYPNIPIMVKPTVDPQVISAVRDAFINMHTQKEGRAVLKKAASVLKLPYDLRFHQASDADYKSYFEFYKLIDLDKADQ